MTSEDYSTVVSRLILHGQLSASVATSLLEHDPAPFLPGGAEAVREDDALEIAALVTRLQRRHGPPRPQRRRAAAPRRPPVLFLVPPPGDTDEPDVVRLAKARAAREAPRSIEVLRAILDDPALGSAAGDVRAMLASLEALTARPAR